MMNFQNSLHAAQVVWHPKDLSRHKDWAVAVVQHGIQSKDSTIQALKAEFKALQKLTQHQEGRISEMEGEVKAHSTAGRMVKSELDSWYVN